MVKKIAIINNKGGVAKTTTATNISSILAEDSDNKILLVDGDAQGNTLVSYGQNPNTLQNTLYDVLVTGVPAKEVIYKYSDNLHILPSNDDLDYLDQDVWTNQGRHPIPFQLLQRALQGQLEPLYTHIIFDASPSMNLINMNILAYADSLIIPFELEETALKGIAKMVKKIAEFKEEQNPKLSIGALLPVKVEARTNLHQMILSEVKSYSTNNNIFLYEEGIPKTVKFAESVTKLGAPATHSFKTHKAIQSYYEFVHLLQERDVL